MYINTSTMKLRPVSPQTSSINATQPINFTQPPLKLHRTLLSARCRSTSSDKDLGKLSDTYTEVMTQKMGTPLLYRHEAGMNYNRILDDLIVGSCLQKQDDVDRLRDTEDVRNILCLQEDSDMDYFSLDITPIQSRCKEVGAINHLRHAIRDFDPFSLRRRLPGAVARLHQSATTTKGTSYIHCTAGLGRAPGTALAYMWWMKGIPLDEAHSLLTSIRPCSPKLAAIRAATVDLLYGGGSTNVTIAVRRRGFATQVCVAGLDIGWGQQLELAVDETHRFVVERELPSGQYQFKFIMDGRWTCSMDHCVILDGDNRNNFLVVPDKEAGHEVAAARQRLRATGGLLTSSEQEKLKELIERYQVEEDYRLPGITSGVPS